MSDMAKLSKLILKPQFTLSRGEGGHYLERDRLYPYGKPQRKRPQALPRMGPQ
ncbi:hypothetical protein MASSI9I_80139 [Massilia sp. 9I]|nr:hypothetical protein MASSI9I_80139 [Massilia sp. 9I]